MKLDILQQKDSTWAGVAELDFGELVAGRTKTSRKIKIIPRDSGIAELRLKLMSKDESLALKCKGQLLAVGSEVEIKSIEGRDRIYQNRESEVLDFEVSASERMDGGTQKIRFSLSYYYPILEGR